MSTDFPWPVGCSRLQANRWPWTRDWNRLWRCRDPCENHPTFGLSVWHLGHFSLQCLKSLAQQGVSGCIPWLLVTQMTFSNSETSGTKVSRGRCAEMLAYLVGDSTDSLVVFLGNLKFLWIFSKINLSVSLDNWNPFCCPYTLFSIDLLSFCHSHPNLQGLFAHVCAFSIICLFWGMLVWIVVIHSPDSDMNCADVWWPPYSHFSHWWSLMVNWLHFPCLHSLLRTKSPSIKCVHT